MKKVILLVAALALIAGTAVAAPTHYMGLYTETTGTPSTCSVAVPAPYMGFTAVHWVLPGDDGVICAEFLVTFPATYFNTGTVVNPGHSVALGSPTANGVSICFAECQRDWFWTYQLTFLPTVTTVEQIQIVGHTDTGAYSVADCRPGYPIAPVSLLNNLHVNEDCIVANETSSWGAIKSMVSE